MKGFADWPEELKKYKEAIEDAEKMHDKKYGKGFSMFFNSAVKCYLEKFKVKKFYLKINL